MKKAHSNKSRPPVGHSAATSRKAKNRKRLAKATEEYFKTLSAEAAAEENEIAQSLSFTAECLNEDLED